MQLRGLDIIEQDGVKVIAIRPEAGTVKAVHFHCSFELSRLPRRITLSPERARAVTAFVLHTHL